MNHGRRQKPGAEKLIVTGLLAGLGLVVISTRWGAVGKAWASPGQGATQVDPNAFGAPGLPGARPIDQGTDKAAPSEIPTVVITETGDCGAGPERTTIVAGTVSGLKDPSTCKIVLYAFGAPHWWVQPWAGDYHTPIASNEKWEVTESHRGTRYVALLVRDGYSAPAQVASLPEPGGDVLARSIPVDCKKP